VGAGDFDHFGEADGSVSGFEVEAFFDGGEEPDLFLAAFFFGWFGIVEVHSGFTQSQ